MCTHVRTNTLADTDTHAHTHKECVRVCFCVRMFGAKKIGGEVVTFLSLFFMHKAYGALKAS